MRVCIQKTMVLWNWTNKGCRFVRHRLTLHGGVLGACKYPGFIHDIEVGTRDIWTSIGSAQIDAVNV
jgi:hypothetical protein